MRNRQHTPIGLYQTPKSGFIASGPTRQRITICHRINEHSAMFRQIPRGAACPGQAPGRCDQMGSLQMLGRSRGALRTSGSSSLTPQPAARHRSYHPPEARRRQTPAPRRSAGSIFWLASHPHNGVKAPRQRDTCKEHYSSVRYAVQLNKHPRFSALKRNCEEFMP